jgi:hypothetical protein
LVKNATTGSQSKKENNERDFDWAYWWFYAFILASAPVLFTIGGK